MRTLWARSDGEAVQLSELIIDASADPRLGQCRGYEIVRTYADEGKSALRIEGRTSLKRLIADVQSGNVDFSAILVYDISRW